MRNLLAFLLLLAAQCGCSPNDTDTVGGKTRKNHEYFIFLAKGTESSQVKAIGSELQSLVEEGIPGDVIHVVEAPSHELLTTLVVPDVRSPKGRLKHASVRGPLSKLAPVFGPEQALSDSGRKRLRLPSVAGAVAALRRTDFPARIVIAGTPIYSEFRNGGWHFTGGYVPGDGALEYAESPFVKAVQPFPVGTQVAWLTPKEWGVDEVHRYAVTRFYRRFFEKYKAALVAGTPNVHSVFHPSGKQFTEDFKLPNLDGHNMHLVTWETIPTPEEAVSESEGGAIAATPKVLLEDARQKQDGVLVLVEWQDPAADLRISAREQDGKEEVHSKAHQTPFGSVYSGAGWQAAKLDGQSLGEFVVWLNARSASKPVAAKVTTVVSGRELSESLTIGPGDNGRATDDAEREASAAWKRVLAPAISGRPEVVLPPPPSFAARSCQHLSVVVALDRSGSMSSELALVGTQARQLASALEEAGATVACCHFSTKVTPVTLRELGKCDAAGGTDTSLLLSTARKSLTRRRDKEQVVCVFTDGSPNNDEACAKEVAACLDAGIRVLVGTVGCTPQELYESMPGAEVFEAHKFEEFITTFISMPSARSQVSLP